MRPPTRHSPICSPTRAALMTGRDPMRLGVVYGVIMPWMNNGIHPAEHFMPESFRAAGYQTAMVGKWHLGTEPEFLPRKQGFDHYYGMPCNFAHSPRFLISVLFMPWGLSGLAMFSNTVLCG